MSVVSIKKGLDIPIVGEPSESISVGKGVKSVALLGRPYHGVKFSFVVKEGDKVKKGQVVANDRTNPEIQYVALGSGTVRSIERGEKRTFLSLIIDLDGSNNVVEREKVSSSGISSLSRDEVKGRMLKGGVWPFLIERPFGITAQPNIVPHSIFVNAMDTNPLAMNPEIIINKHRNDFVDGLSVLTKLTDGQVHLCKYPESNIPHGESGRVINHYFEGVHPAGLSGTHIHYIDPIHSIEKKVWSIGYQDVIALGKFFTMGTLFADRYVALVGPQVINPRIIKTVVGANLFELTAGELKEGAENRIISGSILHGEKADEQVGFLGPFHNQVSVLREDRSRIFHGFMSPGVNKFSVKNIFLSALNRDKKFDFGTSTEGSHRDVVPIGSYEAVMPLDILPTFLVRALLSNDLELAQNIGALELLEEDVALLTYVCPGKNDIGKNLMNVLDQIRKENE